MTPRLGATSAPAFPHEGAAATLPNPPRHSDEGRNPCPHALGTLRMGIAPRMDPGLRRDDIGVVALPAHQHPPHVTWCLTPGPISIYRHSKFASFGAPA
jgi:hypothetical protein